MKCEDIGFTGTRKGMTRKQKLMLGYILTSLGFNETEYFHHGDCLGADEEAATLACALGYIVVSHPPDNDKARAHTARKLVSHLETPTAPYLVRNQNIVDESECLLAAVAGSEVLRSGTWSTVRYAKKIGKKVVIIFPDGRTS